MTNYHLTITTKTQGKLIVLTKYSDLGELVFVEVRDLTNRIGPAALGWIYGQLPLEESGIAELKKQPRIVVQLIDTDLSFEAFWDAYDLKVGTKSSAEKLWNKLDDSTRILALKKVLEYKYWAAKNSTKRVFPERFLSQRRWENEFD